MEKQTPRGLLQQAAARLDLPEDLAAGLSRVELAGFASLTVEGHRGILRFSEQELELAVPDGSIVIQGDRLSIRRMTAQELVVDGAISGLRLLGALSCGC